jgi:glyoxalase family protein
MPQAIAGLHHVTAIASDPQRVLDFYAQTLGLRLVKRTVNFDDPGAYHFYFGDAAGTPGTILTFFVWPQASRGSLGIGETSAVAFRVPDTSLDFWEERLLEAGVPVERADDRFGEKVLSMGGPDWMRVELIGTSDSGEYVKPHAGDVLAQHAIRGFHSATLCESGFELTARILEEMGFRKSEQEKSRTRFAADGDAPGRYIDLLVQPHLVYGRLGAGTIHHIAFRTPDDAAQVEWREDLIGRSLNVTPVLDRNYFRSIYFREPGGVLFEIATDPPGFGIDEPAESLGESLKLPAWLEKYRARIERVLPRIEMPSAKAGITHG